MSRDVWQKTITSLTGDALNGAQVTVRDQETNALAAIFDQKSGGSQRPNPFLTNADGVARFFAEPGFYKVTAFKDGFGTAEFIFNNVGDFNVREDINSVAVGLTGNQTITGVKTFSNNIAANGVFLGGTSSANLLDDYEEGTWTPSNVGSFPISEIVNSTYTKVGRLVTINAYVKASPSSATAFIGGLPFVISGNITGLVRNTTQTQSVVNNASGVVINLFGVTTGTNNDFYINFTYSTA